MNHPWIEDKKQKTAIDGEITTDTINNNKYKNINSYVPKDKFAGLFGIDDTCFVGSVRPDYIFLLWKASKAWRRYKEVPTEQSQELSAYYVTG